MRSKLNTVLALLTLCSATAQAGTALDKVVAIADNEAIMASDLQQRLAKLQMTYRARGMETPPEDKLTRQALDGLILESIQLQLATKAGVRVSDDQLNQTMENIAQQNGLNLEQFQQVLERQGESYEQTREQVRKELTLKRLEQGSVANKIKVTDQEVDAFMASERGKLIGDEEYHLHHLMLEIASDAPAGTLTEAHHFMAELARDAKTSDFAELAKRRPPAGTRMRGGDLGWRKDLPSIFAKVAPRMAVGEVSSPIENPGALHLIKLVEKRGGTQQVAHQTHVRHILIKPSEIRSDQEAERLATNLRARAAKGEDFAALARTFSEDPGSALAGGDLEWTEAGQMVPEFERVMNATAAGQLSQPFKTKFGWHVLQVLERRVQDVSASAQRQAARNAIQKRKYDEELQSWLRRIRDEAYVEIKK